MKGMSNDFRSLDQTRNLQKKRSALGDTPKFRRKWISDLKTKRKEQSETDFWKFEVWHGVRCQGLTIVKYSKLRMQRLVVTLQYNI